MNHGSLFSGIGGFDLASQWCGWDNMFQVEKDPFCRKVLEKNFPQTKRYGDIYEFKGEITKSYRGTIDIISGGFPCQPFSLAGKQKGKEDHRYLWPEMFRVVQEIKPTWIVGENVGGIIGVELDKTLFDLEANGYEVQVLVIPACAVNAPHRRDRVWIIANANSHNFVYQQRKKESSKVEKPKRWRGFSCADFTGGTKARVYRKNDGLSPEMDRLKSLGNAIVPQIAYEIFKCIDRVNEGMRV